MQAEKELIGLLLLNPENMIDVAGLIEADMFRDKTCADAFTLMAHMHKDGKPWRPTIFEDEGYPHDFIIECTHEFLSITRMPDMISEIRSAHCIGSMVRESREPMPDMDHIENIFKKYNELQTGKKALTTKEIFQMAEASAMAPLSERVEFPTPWPSLTMMTGGFRRGTVTFIGARPGHNKTNFLIDALAYLLMRGKKVLMIDCEMSEGDIAYRYTSILSGIPIQWMIHGLKDVHDEKVELTPDEKMRVQAAIIRCGHDLQDLLFIRKHLKPSEIRREIMALKPDVVSIDHLQIFAQISPKEKGETHALHVSNLCREIKAQAGIFNIPFIVASQVTRGSDGGMPTLADLKESGGIEENADVVVNIFTPYVSTANENDKNIFKVLVAKNRRGITGPREMSIDPRTGKIFDCEKRHMPRELQEGEKL